METNMLNKKEASEFLGISVRTLENYMSDGRITAVYEKAAKSRPVAMFAETELDKVKIEIDKAKGVSATVSAEIVATSPQSVSANKDSVSAIVPARNVAGFPQEASAQSYNLTGQDLAVLIEMASQGRGGQVPIENKPLLTFTEAAQLTGLSERSLRVDAKAGKLSAKRQGRADRILRSALDAYLIELQK